MTQDKLFENLNANCPSFMGQNLASRFVADYKKIDIPTSKHEDWRYFNPQTFFDSDYQVNNKFAIESECLKSKPLLTDSYKLFFVNGVFQPTVSDKIENAEVGLLSEMFQRNDERFFSHFDATKVSSEGKFQSLNICFADGIFVAVEKSLDKPIEIIYLNDSENAFAQTHNIFSIAENCEVKFLEAHFGNDKNSTTHNVVTEIFANENSRINFSLLQNENNDARQINSLKVVQSRNSSFTSTSLTMNGGFVRNNIYVNHVDEYCETELNGVFYSTGKQYFENQTKVRHDKPNCSTKELYRGIADNESTSVFAGEISVAKGAQKTSANQSNKNILLSDKATIHSKPQLIIYADDVNCSHGSTIGQLDKDAIFYCQARGIEYSEAVKLLLGAFFIDSMSQIPFAELTNEIDRIVKSKM